VSQFQDLYNQVLSDADFRSQLASNPASALQSVGIDPTPELLAAVQGVISAVSSLGSEFPPNATASVEPFVT
jgi:hypothetical protein